MVDLLTKFIVTLGPAIENKETIKSLITKGINIFRFDLSYKSYETARQGIQWIRKIEEEHNFYVETLYGSVGTKN